MVDQNSIGTQTNGQVIMGGNPYDLVDNKNVQIEQSVSNIQQPAGVSNPEISQNIQQTIPIQQTVSVQQNALEQQNISVQKNSVVEEKGPGNFMKGLIKFIAKVSGQPDPEIGKSEVLPQNTNIVQNNQNGVVQSVQKSGNAFENIMGGVTGFLDKVEKKVEKASGVDLNSFGNMPKKEEIIQQSVEQSQPVQAVQQTVMPVQQFQSPQVPVQQNIPVEQTSVGQVPQDVFKVNNAEPKSVNNIVQNPVQNQSQENNSTLHNISSKLENGVVDLDTEKDDISTNPQIS